MRVRAEYDDAGNFTGFSNRAQLTGSGVIGQPLDSVRDQLTAMGYTVDSLGRITRTTRTDFLVRLTVRNGVVVESTEETLAEAQARLEAGLNPAQQSALAAVRSRVPRGSPDDVVLVEGVYDLRCTYRQVIDANGGRASIIARLTEGDAVTPEDAARIVDGLLARPGHLQLVRGTGALRRFDYRAEQAARGAAAAAGEEVHHVDALYLGGSHELLVGLGDVAHARVHEVFGDLVLPSMSTMPGVRLQPNALQAAVPAGAWRPAAARITGRPAGAPADAHAGQIEYTPL
jgi:hypothetical protein